MHLCDVLLVRASEDGVSNGLSNCDGTGELQNVQKILHNGKREFAVGIDASMNT